MTLNQKICDQKRLEYYIFPKDPYFLKLFDKRKINADRISFRSLTSMILNADTLLAIACTVLNISISIQPSLLLASFYFPIYPIHKYPQKSFIQEVFDPPRSRQKNPVV